MQEATEAVAGACTGYARSQVLAHGCVGRLSTLLSSSGDAYWAMVSAAHPPALRQGPMLGPIANLAHPSISVYVFSLPCFGSAADFLIAGMAYDDSDLDLEDDSADPDEMTYEVNSCKACLLLLQECGCLSLRGISMAAAAANFLALAECSHTAAQSFFS